MKAKSGKYILHANENQKKARVGVYTADKIHFKTKNYNRRQRRS